jgi:DNA-binding SARP family transcriptional activator
MREPIDRLYTFGEGRSMGLSIQLMGKPLVVRDDGPAQPPRGRKAWALLTYLLCSRLTAPREQLASLLFSDADDPLGAVRWNLAELRRLLGDSVGIVGQPVAITLPPGAYVDVRVLKSGTWLEAVSVPGLGAELLEGMSFPGCPGFEAWLLSERRHLQSASEAALREAALARLVAGEEDSAIDFAARLVALNPLDETYQELLIRSFAAGGDREAAARQLTACIELFRRELGVEPTAAVFAALDATGTSFTAAPVTGRAAARAQLEAGEAAIDAGALEPGLQCLRRAAAEAHACGDLPLKARSMFALGAALVYSARGRDEEGAAALHEVIAIALSTGNNALAASAHQVLAVTESLRGRYERARARLASAKELSVDSEPAQASGLVILGECLIETGRYDEGVQQLTEALALAEHSRDLRTAASALTEIGRAHLLRNELPAAWQACERSLEIARSIGMTSFVPYPESILGQVEIATGDLDAATEHLEHAFALGCQLQDPCYEGLGAIGLGLLAAAQGDPGAAIERLHDAIRRCSRTPDSSLWILGYALDALCSVSIAEGMPQPSKWINDLEALAGRTGMRDFLVRAYLHRHDLGDPTALDAAVLLASEVDNPYLHESIARRREAFTIAGVVRPTP